MRNNEDVHLANDDVNESEFGSVKADSYYEEYSSFENPIQDETYVQEYEDYILATIEELMPYINEVDEIIKNNDPIESLEIPMSHFRRITVDKRIVSPYEVPDGYEMMDYDFHESMKEFYTLSKTYDFEFTDFTTTFYYGVQHLQSVLWELERLTEDINM